MIQPVYHQEMLLAGRRQRTHFLRWIYLLILLAQLAPLFFLRADDWKRLLMSGSGFGFFEQALGRHFFLLYLLTPGLTAAAICEEKTRRTLDYLLSADLTATDIVLGKLLARITQLLVLSLLGLPLFSFFAGLMGDLSFPVAVAATSLTLTVGLASLSILASVWCRSTRDALLSLYGLGAAIVLVQNLFPGAKWLAWLESLGPFPVLAQSDPVLRWTALGQFLLRWLLVGGLAMFLACWRLRPAYRRQLVHAPSRWRRLWPLSWLLFTRGRRKVRGNPVLWRERCFEGIAPVAGLRSYPRWLGLIAVWLLAGASLAYLLIQHAPGRLSGWSFLRMGELAILSDMCRQIAGPVFYCHGLGFLVLLTLLAAIRASAAITGEKESGTWLALAITPMTTQKIVHGKLWGIFWAAFPYAFAYAAAAVPLGVWLGVEATAWAILWPLVTLLAVILGSALGLWASARASSSWRSLLTTLALFYAGCLFTFLPVSVVLFVTKGIVQLILGLIGLFQDLGGMQASVAGWNSWMWAALLGVGLAYFALTERLLAAAVARLGRSDRADGLDYFYLVRDYQRKQDEKALEMPKVIYWEEPEEAGQVKVAEKS